MIAYDFRQLDLYPPLPQLYVPIGRPDVCLWGRITRWGEVSPHLTHCVNHPFILTTWLDLRSQQITVQHIRYLIAMECSWNIQTPRINEKYNKYVRKKQKPKIYWKVRGTKAWVVKNVIIWSRKWRTLVNSKFWRDKVEELSSKVDMHQIIFFSTILFGNG